MHVSATLNFFVGLAVVSVTHAAGSCDQTYQCQYTHSDLKNNVEYKFDFSSLCDANGGNDFKATDTSGHTYYAKICGQAATNCLPQSWTNTYEYGVAVQAWGAVPSCNPPSCSTRQPDGSTKAACCTADCQVLGTGVPTWSLANSLDPVRGGVIAAYKGAAASDSDPFWCDFNPATGAQFEREVHFVFTCDESVETVQIKEATQNKTNDCRYKVYFATKFACADTGKFSGGWMFIILVASLAAVYLVFGSIIGFVQTKKWDLPNKIFWADFGDNVRAGIAFTASGFKKGQVSSSSGSSAQANDLDGGATFTATSYQGLDNDDKDNAYSDL